MVTLELLKEFVKGRRIYWEKGMLWKFDSTIQKCISCGDGSELELDFIIKSNLDWKLEPKLITVSTLSHGDLFVHNEDFYRLVPAYLSEYVPGYNRNTETICIRHNWGDNELCRIPMNLLVEKVEKTSHD